ncbi:MAG: ABC transporter permease [Acidocella sp.]|nr:ABC transporter permease [Acidocella sp.]
MNGMALGTMACTTACILGLLARLLIGTSWALPLALLALAASIWASVRLARQNDRLSMIASPVIFGLTILWAWEMLVVGLHVPFILLPPPSAIALALVTHFGELANDFDQTVLHAVLAGYAIGCGGGFLIALAIDRSLFLQRGLTPLANMISAMPIIGIAPIAIEWFGFDWPSKAAVVVLMTIFPMLVNTRAGLQQTNPMEQDLMRSYGAGYIHTLIKLRLPAALPMIFNALKLNTTLAMIGAIVAEFFGTPTRGMGFRISVEAARMNLDIVWATIAIAALAGSSSFALIGWAERRITSWHPSFHTRSLS